MSNQKRPYSPTGNFWVIRDPDNTSTWSASADMVCAFTSEDGAKMLLAELDLENHLIISMNWITLVEVFGKKFEKVLIDYFPDTSMGHIYDLKI